MKKNSFFLKCLLKFFCLIIFSNSFSQTVPYTPDPPLAKENIHYTVGLLEKSKSEKPFSYFFWQENFFIDTTLEFIHIYDPVHRAGFAHRNIGNLGSESFALTCCDQPQPGLQLGFNAFNIYRFDKNNVRFFKNVHPYTQLNFLVGTQKEQAFEVTHAQDIKKKFNFGFHYRRYASEGNYRHQQKRHNNIALTSRFDSKKNYLLKTILIFNNARALENGGVVETSIFDDTTFLSKELVDVELETAEVKSRDIAFHLRHSWNFGRQNFSADSIANDSLRNDSIPALQISSNKQRGQLYHELDLKREKYEFIDTDPDSAYYGIFHPSNVNDNDTASNKMFNISNRLGLQKSFAKYFGIDVSAAYAINKINLFKYETQFVPYLETRASLFSKTDTSSPFDYGASFTYSFIEYTANDYWGDAFLNFRLKKFGNIHASASFSQRQPDWIFSQFGYGILKWHTDFNKQNILTAQFAYHLPEHSFFVSTSYHRISYLAYFNETRLPAQTNSVMDVWVFELIKNFRFKGFGWNNLARFTWVSNEKLLRFPFLRTAHTLFYERYLFKNKLQSRIGIDIRYNTDYSAPGFFPLTGQFYLQDEQEMSYYPVLDLFLSFKIKTVRIFLLMQHLNQGMFKQKGYFNAYKYPAADRNFRIGVSWIFLN